MRLHSQFGDPRDGSRPACRRARGSSAPRWLVIAAWIAIGSAAAALAQVVFTVDDLDKAMKAVGRNLGLANAAVATKDFEGAKVRIARAREQLSPTVSFWTNAQQAEAVRMVRAATARLDELDAALSASPVDAAVVAAAAASVDAACAACHAVYREEDPAAGTFKLKSGAVGAPRR